MKILELLPWLAIVALALAVLRWILPSGRRARSVGPAENPQNDPAGSGDPPTRDAVVRRVHSEYPAEAAFVLSELDSYSGREPERVKMDILILSAGSFEDLKRWTRMASNDYRDVLSAAEYGNTPRGSEILRAFREPRPESSWNLSFKDLMEEDSLKEKSPHPEAPADR